MKDKVLVVGLISDDFDPNIHIPISPACFIGREHIFDNWEDLDFVADPFACPEERYQGGRETSKYALKLIAKWSIKLNHELNTDFSFSFWKKMLFPYFLFLLQAILDKQERVKAVIEKYKNDKVSIFLDRRNEQWNFKDSEDFLHNGLQTPKFATWLYKQIFEYIELPDSWEIVYVLNEEPEIIQPSSGSNKISFKSKLADIFNAAFRRCNNVYGFSLLDRVIFHVLLSLKKPTSKAKLEKFSSHSIDTQIEFDCDIDAIIESTVPKSIRFLPNLAVEKRARFTIGKYNLGSQYLLHNDKLKLRYALACENGEHIIGVQHGGHDYGSSKVFDILRETEYACKHFITWGFTQQGAYKKNLIGDLPSPYLASYLNKHQNKSNKVILVSTKMNLFVHRFEGLPHPCQNLEYREMKARFIGGINKEIFNRFYYRPYFNDHGGLKDTSFFLERFPKINILKGNLHPHILQCQLLILDHPGTTLNIAFTSNIPTICLWKNEHFPFTQQASSFLKRMKALNLYFEDSEEAVQFVNTISQDVNGWWNQPEIKNFREDWCKAYSFTNKNWRREWKTYIQAIQ